MAECFEQYWYLAVIFVVVCIIAAVRFYFAGRSYKAYRTSYKNQEAEIKRLIALKERFVPLSEKAILESDNAETLEGTALSYQLYLQKQEDMEKEFALLSEAKRYIYILDVFVQDKSVADFFRENGDILRMEITKALSFIGMTEFAESIEKIRRMFDVDDENTSFNEAEIEKLQAYIDENDILTKVKLESAEYIKKNFQLFVN